LTAVDDNAALVSANFLANSSLLIGLLRCDLKALGEGAELLLLNVEWKVLPVDTGLDEVFVNADVLVVLAKVEVFATDGVIPLVPKAVVFLVAVPAADKEEGLLKEKLEVPVAGCVNVDVLPKVPVVPRFVVTDEEVCNGTVLLNALPLAAVAGFFILLAKVKPAVFVEADVAGFEKTEVAGFENVELPTVLLRPVPVLN